MLRVKAAPGLKVPMEDKPHDYITDAEAVEVPESAYTLRRLADGDLVEVEASAAPVKAKK
ncbi:MAG: DUF2635 domain-containing protein [Pseudomonadota bacterium]|nr:DUF2635 domain-containing protein [Pseudomonadota bacterium]